MDPRSGEIINGTIFVGHDIAKTIASQRFVQTAQVDERMRGIQLSEEALLEGIRLYVAREVGHCLGLADNASASAAFSVESLRSPEFTRQNGIASSVMDELPYNYIAQPQDGKADFIQNKLGAYDLFAIQMGYMLVPDAKTPEEIREKIMRWVSMKSGDPVYRYGKAQYQGAEYDPSALGGDLGNNAVKAGKYGISNLKYILGNMDKWVEQQDSDYRFRIQIYPEIVNRYNQYLMYAFRNVGGFYLSEHIVGDRNQALSVVSKAQQREAARFVMNELCNMTWLDDSSILRNMPVQTPVYQKLIKNFATALVATKRVSLAYYKDKNSYSPEEYLNDIYSGVWASTLKGKSLNRAEMLLQYEVVAAILRKLQLPNHMETTGREKKGKKIETLLQSVRPEVNTVGGFGPLGYITNLSNDNQLHLYHGLLIRIQKLMESRLNSGSDETRMHYGQLLEKIEDIRNW
ncbi:MAG: zinc-dependent metalloprotease [Bacteroides ovatus]